MMKFQEALVDKESAKKQVIYLSDDESKNVYFLKKGKIKISKFSDDGKEHIIAILGPGEIFGESPLLGSEIMGEDAEVLEDAVICSMDYQKFQDFLREHPEMNFQVTKLIGFKLKKIQSKLETLCFKSAEERVKHYIKDLAEQYGKKNEYTQDIILRLNVTHDDLAKLTATTRQKVTTVLSSLVKQGVIEYQRKKIVVRDITKL